ncbi:T9SS type A sorting domain-containing protein [candidate division WOR-3 bacterium]|nr:T9SS type A sorting domain-containing protein [candidate division WOR-3 bacterium]
MGKFNSVIFYITALLIISSPLYAGEVIQTQYSESKHEKYRPREGKFLVDTNVLYVQARGNQGWPSVAFDGTNYLVVWQDSRCFPQHDIYGARVSFQGVVLDSAGIHIATVTYDCNQAYCDGAPAVSYNGSEYFVVWQDRQYSSEIDIYGARITTSGVILDSNGIPISTATGYQRHPSVTSDGTGYLVAWQDERSGTPDIYGTRIDAAGVVLDPAGILICNAVNGQLMPSVACDGNNYFAIWQDARDTTSNQYDIYGARINTNGILIDTNAIAISAETSSQLTPSVTFDGTNFFVVWEDRHAQSLGIYGARVNTAGFILDPGGIAISGIPNLPEWNPSVTFNGTNYLVVWGDDRNGTYPDIYGARVDQSGTVLDTLNIPICVTSGVKEMPAVASDGSDFLVVWEDDRDYPAGDVYASRVSATGTVLDPQGVDVTTAAAFQDNPGAACGTTNFLVAWGDYRNGLYSSDIYGTRVDATGNILDSPSFVICNAPFGQYSPSIAFDGTNYCAVWTHNIGGAWAAKGTRVNPMGIVLDPSYINISSGGNALSPHIASSGNDFLAVWVDYRNSYTSPDIYGARIDSNGSVLDPTGIAISTVGEIQYNTSTTFGSTVYFVVWRDNRNGLHDIYGARIASNGVVLDPNGIAISTATSFQDYASVAFDGTNYLVVWQDERNGSPDIYGARVGQSGVVLDPNGIPLSTAPCDQTKPSVSFDGTYYLIAWEDNRNGPPSDIYGALVNTSGVVVDSFTISTQSGTQTYPTIAYGAGSQALIVYTGWADHINAHPANAMRTWGTFYPTVGIKEDAGYTIHDTRLSLTASPNPFTHFTDIRYQITDNRYKTANTNAAFSIYDAGGRLVKDFGQLSVIGYQSSVQWDGTDQANRQLGNGVYFAKLTAGNYSITEKILLVR